MTVRILHVKFRLIAAHVPWLKAIFLFLGHSGCC